MKRLLTLFLVLWCSTAWAVEPINLARSNPYVLGAGAAAASGCTTEHASYVGDHVSYITTHDVSGTAYWAGQTNYDPGATIDICEIDLYLIAYGTITGGSYWVDIYTTGAGSPPAMGTLVKSSAAVAGNGSWANSKVTFAFSGTDTIANGSTYIIAIRTDNAQSDTNRIGVSRQTSTYSGWSSFWASDLSVTGFDGDDTRMTIRKR